MKAKKAGVKKIVLKMEDLLYLVYKHAFSASVEGIHV